MRDGQRGIYFALPTAPWGSMAARWAPAAVRELPALYQITSDDNITAAAMANPGMSALAALVSADRTARKSSR